MTKSFSVPRRQFLTRLGQLAGAGWLGSHLPAILLVAESAQAAQQNEAHWQHLSSAEAAVLAAVADQIWPPDDTPGGADLGVVHFIDQAMGGFMAGALPLLQVGCGELQAAAREQGADGFALLPFTEQTTLLKQIEDGPFFDVVHVLTVCGLFAMPGYGGNRERGGWESIGFESRHVWQPPFGYYDAQAAGLVEGSDAGT